MLPLGTVKNGKIRIKDGTTGKISWRSGRSGMVMPSLLVIIEGMLKKLRLILFIRVEDRRKISTIQMRVVGKNEQERFKI